nr:uncharacterized mitochondrial protein AtMg00810-like [Tanacetum cinerariifolium]
MKYEDIRPIFDRVYDQVHTFLPKDSEIDKEIIKRAGFDLQQGSSKKQRIIPNEDIAIDAIPLATKPLVIVEYKILKEGKISTYLIVRANGSIKGLPLKQKDDGIFISQDKYVANILKKFDLTTVKTASTPMEPNKELIKDVEAEDVDVHLYRSMIGSLMYLTASRPDIMFAVCACARFQVTPKTSHFHAVKRIFRYLKGQSKLGLWYPRDSPFDL